MSNATDKSPDESPDRSTDTNKVTPVQKETASSEKDEDNNDPSALILQEKETTKNVVLPTKKIVGQNKRISTILALQALLMALLLIWGTVYAFAHNVPSIYDFFQNTQSYYEAIANYNFLGVGPENPQPSLIAVIYEVVVWSFAGILARQQYYLTQLVIRRKDIRILEIISMLIGNAAMGVSIAIAVVAFLRTTEFVNLSLKTADIGSIVAISFILGFYHEDTRRLLGSFQKRISGTATESKKDEEE